MEIKFIFFWINIAAVSSSVCPRNGWAHSYTSDSCCDSHHFFSGDFRSQYSEECFHHPMDETLPYTENHWAFYECIIKKSLGHHHLNQDRYVEIMSRNMSTSKKQLIVDYLLTDVGALAPPEDSSFRQRLKFFWKRYMDAEFTVCATSIQTQCKQLKSASQAQKCLTTARLQYEPPIFCKIDREAKWANPFRFTEQQHAQCFANYINKLQRYFTPDKKKALQDRSFFLCWLHSVDEFFKFDDLYNPLIDFDHYFKRFAPRFLSNTSRGLLSNAISEILRKRKINVDPSAPFHDFILLFSSREHMYKLAEDSRMLININALMYLVALIQEAQAKVCRKQWSERY